MVVQGGRLLAWPAVYEVQGSHKPVVSSRPLTKMGGIVKSIRDRSVIFLTHIKENDGLVSNEFHNTARLGQWTIMNFPSYVPDFGGKNLKMKQNNGTKPTLL